MPIGPVAVEYEWTTEIHLISAAAARNVSHSMRSGRQDARTNGLAGGLWENQFSFPCFTGSLDPYLHVSGGSHSRRETLVIVHGVER